MRFVRSAAVAAVAVTAGGATAQTPLFGGSLSHGKRGQVDNKIYPLSENKYIKQFPGPRVSCGACFGFYKPSVRPWHEACGEPEPENFGPKTYSGGSAVPDLPDPPVGDKKPADPTPVDKNGKGKEAAPPPNQGKEKEKEKEPTIAIPVPVAPLTLPPIGK